MTTDIFYLVAGLMFIFGIKNLTKVKTARRGNLLAATAMLLAVVATLLHMETIGWALIIAGLIAGGLIGVVLALFVKITAMPQLVAVFNGLGGGASTLVALSYVWSRDGVSLGGLDLTTVVLSLLIGTVAFTGSVVAFGKLQGLLSSRPFLFWGSKSLNLLLFLAVPTLAVALVVWPASFHATEQALLIVGIAALLGILLVTPIGGADMPVVISLLNAYSGLAAASTGFVLQNLVLIISGALVAASGLILTKIMCKAMNRSLTNVLFGGFGQEVSSGNAESAYTSVKGTGPEEAAMILDGGQRVVIVPGYGMAVAQAQHAVKELTDYLEKNGKQVLFAIHPVAGRMPGHMNVLLAEADIDYEKLKTLEEANQEFRNTDVVIVIGANDVVNPAAVQDKISPIYGMPTLKVHEARTVLVVKRSLSPGFAGIKNELFEAENALMLFGDGKKMVCELLTELKEL